MPNGKPGRPRGLPKSGGRQKGSLNKTTTAMRQAAREALLSHRREQAAEKRERAVAERAEREAHDAVERDAGGAMLSSEQASELSPRDVMLRVMRIAIDQGNIPLALAAADKVAPYVHQRLAQTEVNATVRRSLEEFTTAELMALASGADSETSGRPN